MSGVKPGQAERCVEALKALYADPMTLAEKVAYASLCARKDVEAWDRITGKDSPQMEIGLVQP